MQVAKQTTRVSETPGVYPYIASGQKAMNMIRHTICRKSGNAEQSTPENYKTVNKLHPNY